MLPKSRHADAGDTAIPAPPAWAKTSGAALGVATQATPRAQRRFAGDVASADLADLLGAVTSRLRQTFAAPAQASDAGAAARERAAAALECADALAQLQTTLTHELMRRQDLELEVFDARCALAQVRAELSGSRAGVRPVQALAPLDRLTSLPDARTFHERLEQALARGGLQAPALALLYIELDGFKPINEVHGHDVGDALLKIVAARLARAMRAEDLVSRLGGDQFACLLGSVPDREQLTRLACKLFDAVSAPIRLNQLVLTMRPSIGIAISRADGVSAQALLSQVEGAMRQAKREQTGYAFFDQRSA